MSRFAPKPVISQVIRTWHVELGMTFAVAEDIDGRLWIEQSCPVGTHYWTAEQAVGLSDGLRTAKPIQEAVALCCERQSLDHLPTLLPIFDWELESAISREPNRNRRVACSVDSRLARV